MKKRTKQSILTLGIEGQILSYTHAASNGGKVTHLQCGEIPLKINPMDVSPEVAACELEEALNSKGLKERSCLYVVPARYVTCREVTMPDGEIDAEDLDDFLTIEAERLMPFASGEIATHGVRFSGHDGSDKIGLTACEQSTILHISEMCRKAGLKTECITTGASMLQSLHDGGDAIVVARESGIIHFLHFVSGVLVRSRALSGDSNAETNEPVIDELALQISVTLGGQKSDVKISVLGDEAEMLIKQLEKKLPNMPLECWNDFLMKNVTAECSTINYRTMVAAVTYLTTDHSAWVDFSRTKEPPFKFLTKYPLWNKYFKQTVVAGAILLVAVLCLVWQKSHLLWLESRMSSIKENHEEILTVSKDVKHLSRWFSTKQYTLQLMKVVTEAFPEKGDVWVTSLSIDDGDAVIIKGSAVSRATLLQVVSTLLKTPGVQNLNQGKIQSDSATKTIRFSLTFDWKGGRL